MTRTRWIIAGGCLIALILTVGLVLLWRNHVTQRPAITWAEATQQVERYAQDALAHMPGSPRLDRPARTPIPCDDPADHAPTNSEEVSDSYVVVFPSAVDNGEVIESLFTYWHGQGYRTLQDRRSGTSGRLIGFENPRDGYRVGILEAVTTPRLTLQISSPCAVNGP